MKIECVKEKLQNAVSKAEKIVSKNINTPVLSCLLLETKGNELLIRATNLDLGIEITIPIKKEKDGKVCVPANILSSFLNSLSDDKNIKIEEKEGILAVSTERNHADIKMMTTEDFPTIPTIEDGKVCKINTKELQNGIKSVIYSASTSSVKPELASVYVYSNEENLIFVSTDSFRLAEKIIKTKKKVDLSGVLIPAKNAADLLKIVEGIEEDVELNSTKNQISFSLPGMYIISRVIDGTFPDYKQILPKEEKTRVVLLKQDLINTLKTSNIFSDNFNQINISVNPKEKNIETKTKNSNIGESVNKINANIEGEEIIINFNFRYITDCLASVPQDSVSLSFNGINKPLVIRGSTDKNFTYLVMPMNR